MNAPDIIYLSANYGFDFDVNDASEVYKEPSGEFTIPYIKAPLWSRTKPKFEDLPKPCVVLGLRWWIVSKIVVLDDIVPSFYDEALKGAEKFAVLPLPKEGE